MGAVRPGPRTHRRPPPTPPADAEGVVEGVAAFAASLGNVPRVDVLPFRKLGTAKREAVGRVFPLAGTPVPTPEQVAAARGIFTAHGLYAV